MLARSQCAANSAASTRCLFCWRSQKSVRFCRMFFSLHTNFATPKPTTLAVQTKRANLAYSPQHTMRKHNTKRDAGALALRVLSSRELSASVWDCVQSLALAHAARIPLRVWPAHKRVAKRNPQARLEAAKSAHFRLSAQCAKCVVRAAHTAVRNWRATCLHNAQRFESGLQNVVGLIQLYSILADLSTDCALVYNVTRTFARQ